MDNVKGFEMNAQPLGLGAPATEAVSGIEEDGSTEEGGERLQGLPAHEDDHRRGADLSEGAGILSAGGTARDTGESTGDEGTPGEELQGEERVGSILPLPIVGDGDE